LAGLLAATAHGRLHLIIGVMADKDIGGVLAPILPLADHVYLTRPKYHRAATPEHLLERIRSEIGEIDAPTALYPDLPKAINAAAKAAGPWDLVVISGSLFTVGEARAYLTGLNSVESN
jgi:dihydrofolate synthase/folylpolyglutamate synthase